MKTCDAFHWTLYIVLASFIAWGVGFKVIDMNLLDTNPVSKTVHMKKKTPVTPKTEKVVQLPMKPAADTLSAETRNCKLTRYEGDASIKGWYEQEEIYGKKVLVLKVADTDRVKLPERIQKWADGTPLESIILDNVSAEMKKLLIKASAQEPTVVDLVAIDVYCEGPPVAVLAK